MAKWYHPDSEFSEISKSDYTLRCQLVKIIETHVRDLNNSYNSGPVMAVPEDDLEDVAEEIMAAFNIEKNK